MKNENTILDNEKTVYNNNDTETTHIEERNNQVLETRSVATTSASTGKIVATGLGGVLLGTIASSAAIFSALSDDENIEEVVAESETAVEDVAIEESSETPEWSNGQVSFATDVTDNMSFGEAFATARAVVGAGGAFEWRGNVYGTYLAEEWDNMTAEEKADYNAQFNWGAIDTTNNGQTAQELVETETVEQVEHTDYNNYDTYDNSETYTDDAETEIEVLGVVTDPESGNSVAPLIIEGEPVVLVDIDSDQTFDLLAADLDNNLELSDDEILDIREYGITVDDVASSVNEDWTDSSVDYGLATDDAIDYSGEIDI